ncbi:MAG: class I SAM-dependent methyltransferase [Pseudomonadota bacterium]
MTTFDSTWDEIYGAGEQLNLYPFSSIVTFLFRHRPRDKDRADTKVLEIGCGAGNNLWFAAREGFDVTGLDASPPALAFARKRFEAEGLQGQFLQGDFTELPFADNSFDIILERAAVSQAPKPAARQAVAECARVLRPGGCMYAEIYSDRATTRGTPIDGGLLVDTDGPYAGVGQIAFYSQSEIRGLFDGLLDIEGLDHTETISMVRKPYEVYASWAVTARHG